jgi:hypothetical protein
MTKTPHPSFALVPALGAAGLFAALVALPLDFPYSKEYQNEYLTAFLESTILGLASASVLCYFRLLRSWLKLLGVVGTIVGAHLLERALDPRLPQPVIPCWDCSPTSHFSTEVAIRFLLVGGTVFTFCLGFIEPRPKLAWLFLLSAGSSFLGAWAIGFLDAQAQWAHAALVFNGIPLGLLWQPTLAVFLGIATSASGFVGPASTQGTDDPARCGRIQNRYAGLFALGIFVVVFVAWGTVIGHSQGNTTAARYAWRDSQIARSKLETPPPASLPKTQSAQTSDLMVTENLEDWKIFRSGNRHLDATPNGSLAVFPEGEIYRASFARASTPYYMDVEITQYPNHDWARYELRNTPNANSLYTDHEVIRQVTKFGSTFYEDAPHFYWSSGDKLIHLDCAGILPGEIDRFLKAYLQKYPSSVQVADGLGLDSDRQ